MKEPLEKSKLSKIFSIIGNVVFFIIVILALFTLIITITSKKDDDGTATVFGYQLRFVRSDSMNECEFTDVSEFDIKSIPIKSCVFIEVAPEDDQEKENWYKALSIGDVLTFKYVYTKQETITHRITDIKEKESGGFIITLEGDNKDYDTNLLTQIIDTSIEESPNYVIGKVVGQSYFLGLLVHALKSTIGIISLIIVPCLAIMIYEIIKIVKLLSKDKKQLAFEREQKQANEIEELKKQLAELQAKNISNYEEESRKDTEEKNNN